MESHGCSGIASRHRTYFALNLANDCAIFACLPSGAGGGAFLAGPRGGGGGAFFMGFFLAIG